jgi:hypothetical protein
MDKKLAVLMSLFILSFLLLLTLIFFNKPISTLTRASEELVPSGETSIIFVPTIFKNQKSDGKTPVEIDIFVRNNKNVPLGNKKVTLRSTLGTVKENDILTGNDSKVTSYGKAIFFLTSDTSGNAQISATVEHNGLPVKITKTVSINFE